MNRNTPLSRSRSLGWLCLILHVCWMTGLGVHTLCLETDGERHAEWSATGCAAACDAAAASAEAGTDGPSIALPQACVDCTDLTVDQPGLRHPRLTPTILPVLPVPPQTHAWLTPPKSLPRAMEAHPPSGLTSSGALPLRC